jgi:hypothetical protein
MGEKIFINNFLIEADQLHVSNADKEPEPKKISISFQVTHKDYHDVTTLLYENDFIVEVPTENLKFPAQIHSYSTSVTNLYKENAVGDFKLELQEKE